MIYVFNRYVIQDEDEEEEGGHATLYYKTVMAQLEQLLCSMMGSIMSAPPFSSYSSPFDVLEREASRART